MNRVEFLKSLGISSVAMLSTISLTGASSNASPSIDTIVQDAKPPLKPELVKEFVIAGHGDLDKVKAMLEKQPHLLNASWDWGDGDFEEAIEGAGHVGNRDIALYLISKGARMNIFTAAMLGNFHIVQQMIDSFPELLKAQGPHGLDLLHHATAGGEQALRVLNFLKHKK
jgi:hypothetical protein